jgi:hypothetical protein
MTTNQKLEELIPQYALNKTEADSYKKLCEKQNAEIKILMANGKHSKYEVGDYTASVSVSERQTINENYIIPILQQFQEKYEADTLELLGIVKFVPSIDYDALERAIYKGKLPQEILMEIDKATERKKVETLRVTRKGEKKK